MQKLVATTIGLILVFVAIAIVSFLLWRSERMARYRRREAETKAHRLAFFDPLTELPNRACFMEQATLILAENDSPTLILIDLDEFKAVNDTFGHQIGDNLLIVTAQRCKDLFDAKGGLVARLGGDEFAAMLPSCSEVECLHSFSEELIKTLSEPFTRDGFAMRPQASIGIATPEQLRGDAPPTLSTLIRAADYALYKAKADGRGISRIYDADLADTFSRRREMKLAMPAALERGEFFLEFQPQVYMRSGVLQDLKRLCDGAGMAR